jgi:hypothetical protein
MPITTKVVSSNPIHGEVYSIQQLCDKVCQCLATCQWFSQSTPVSSTNKTDRYDITEVLLNVKLNTINLTNEHEHDCFNYLLYLLREDGRVCYYVKLFDYQRSL